MLAYQIYVLDEILFPMLCGQHVRIGAVIRAHNGVIVVSIYGANCPIT